MKILTLHYFIVRGLNEHFTKVVTTILTKIFNCNQFQRVFPSFHPNFTNKCFINYLYFTCAFSFSRTTHSNSPSGKMLTYFKFLSFFCFLTNKLKGVVHVTRNLKFSGEQMHRFNFCAVYLIQKAKR